MLTSPTPARRRKGVIREIVINVYNFFPGIDSIVVTFPLLSLQPSQLPPKTSAQPALSSESSLADLRTRSQCSIPDLEL